MTKSSSTRRRDPHGTRRVSPDEILGDIVRFGRNKLFAGAKRRLHGWEERWPAFHHGLDSLRARADAGAAVADPDRASGDETNASHSRSREDKRGQCAEDLASVIYAFRRDTRAFYLSREAERQDLVSDKLQDLAKRHPQMGKVYALPYLSVHEKLAWLGVDFDLIDRVLQEMYGCKSLEELMQQIRGAEQERARKLVAEELRAP